MAGEFGAKTVLDIGTLTNDQAYDLVIDVAAGHLDSVGDSAGRLRTATEPRS